MTALGHFNYFIFIILMMIGFYIVMSRSHLVLKLIGLSLFQTSIFIFYISLGKVSGGTAPVLIDTTLTGTTQAYSAPLPHVLILTAIVVGVATTAVGLALVMRIHVAYGGVLEVDLLKQDLDDAT